MKDKLDTHKLYMTTYRMYKDSERELRFSLAVAVSYQNGDRGKHGEVVRGYVACGVTKRSAKQVKCLYKKSVKHRNDLSLTPAITLDHDDTKSSRAVCDHARCSTIGEPVAVAAVGGRHPLAAGGRKLPEKFTFKSFSARSVMSGRELRRQWENKANGLVYRCHR